MDNSTTEDNETPSGITNTAPDTLAHKKVLIQPIHSDVIPEDVIPEQSIKSEGNIAVNKSANSILNNLRSTYKPETKDTSLYDKPSYQREVTGTKRKPLYGLYALVIILVVNAIDIFLVSTALSGTEANFVRFLSAMGLLMGVGLFMRKEFARILTIALFLLLAILSFGFIRRVICVAVIIYLVSPKVKEEFES